MQIYYIYIKILSTVVIMPGGIRFENDNVVVEVISEDKPIRSKTKIVGEGKQRNCKCAPIQLFQRNP